MPILDANGNVKKPRGPRRTECPSCESLLIEGEGGQDMVSSYGKNFEVCPECVFKKLMKMGMKPEQQMQFDIVRKEPTGKESGWGLGIVISIKGYHNSKNSGIEMVLTEEQLRDFLGQIEEAKKI